MRRRILLAALLVTGCSGGGGAREDASIRWVLADVSDDARTISVFHEEHHCQSRPGRPEVRETSSVVRVRIPLEDADLQGAGCTADLRYMTSRVRLAAPLATRALQQPKRRTRAPGVPSSSRCPRLLRAPRDAPLFDVPRFARALARCERPVPAAVLALPLLRRPASPADRLGPQARRELASGPTYQRLELARGTRVGRGSVVLAPGAEESCASFRSADGFGELVCGTTALVVRRGLFVEDVCEDRTPPRRVTVTGVAPAGVRSVRLTRRERTVARAAVRRGAYEVAGNDALRLHVGGAQLRLRAATTDCG